MKSLPLYGLPFILVVWLQEVPQISVTHPVDGQAMRFNISAERLENGTSWRKSDPNPPLAVRDALVKGEEALKHLASKNIISRDVNWGLEEVILRQVDAEHWFYRLVYRSPTFHRKTSIILFMDGSWLMPSKETDWSIPSTDPPSSN